MSDLHVEIRSNIDLVGEKRRLQAPDTQQFVRVLCEDVRQFLVCMADEMHQVLAAIDERHDKGRAEMASAEAAVARAEAVRAEIAATGMASSKELARVDAFKEHVVALKRHMENTSAYLKKEYNKVNDQIAQAKLVMKQSLGVDIDNFELQLD